jgi:hypothetical protein
MISLIIQGRQDTFRPISFLLRRDEGQIAQVVAAT